MKDSMQNTRIFDTFFLFAFSFIYSLQFGKACVKSTQDTISTQQD